MRTGAVLAKKAARNMPSGPPGSKFFRNKKDRRAAPVLPRLSGVGCWLESQDRFRNQEHEACCGQGTIVSADQTYPDSVASNALAPIGRPLPRTADPRLLLASGGEFEHRKAATPVKRQVHFSDTREHPSQSRIGLPGRVFRRLRGLHGHRPSPKPPLARRRGRASVG